MVVGFACTLRSVHFRDRFFKPCGLKAAAKALEKLISSSLFLTLARPNKNIESLLIVILTLAAQVEKLIRLHTVHMYLSWYLGRTVQNLFPHFLKVLLSQEMEKKSPFFSWDGRKYAKNFPSKLSWLNFSNIGGTGYIYYCYYFLKLPI